MELPEPPNADGAQEAVAGVLPPRSPTAKRRGGAKPQYPWAEFETEALRRAGSSSPPVSERALATEMLGWCSENWHREPGESTLRHRLKRLLSKNGLKLG